jgi:hypothetical protein
VICLEKQKLQLQAISHPGLIPSEQGLYFFTREEAIESLQFTEEAFKKAAA